MRARNSTAARILRNNYNWMKSDKYRNYWPLFRRAVARYGRERIRPYLVLPGVVEIDETKINNKSNYMGGGVHYSG